jgi:hypothetical protein
MLLSGRHSVVVEQERVHPESVDKTRGKYILVDSIAVPRLTTVE